MNQNRIITLLVSVVTIGAAIFIYWMVTFHLVSTYPANNSTTMPTYQTISFNFNQVLSNNTSKNQFSISPTVSGQTVITKKSLVFTPDKPLAKNQTYTVKLTNITAINGKTISPITITFKTIYVPLSQLPASAEKRFVANQDQQYEAPTPENKLKATLPYQTSQYTISFNGSYTVQIKSSDVTSAESAANAYITSFGVDPSTLSIYYNVPAVYSGKPGP